MGWLDALSAQPGNSLAVAVNANHTDTSPGWPRSVSYSFLHDFHGVSQAFIGNYRQLGHPATSHSLASGFPSKLVMLQLDLLCLGCLGPVNWTIPTISPRLQPSVTAHVAPALEQEKMPLGKNCADFLY